MTKTTIICDRCLKEITHPKNCIPFQAADKTEHTLFMAFSLDARGTADICNPCLKTLITSLP